MLTTDGTTSRACPAAGCAAGCAIGLSTPTVYVERCPPLVDHSAVPPPASPDQHRSSASDRPRRRSGAATTPVSRAARDGLLGLAATAWLPSISLDDVRRAACRSRADRTRGRFTPPASTPMRKQMRTGLPTGSGDDHWPSSAVGATGFRYVPACAFGWGAGPGSGSNWSDP